MNRNMSQLGSGEQAAIRRVGGDRELGSRLQELGFTPGTPVRLMARAAFGGPMAFQVRGSVVAVRRSDAAWVEI